MNVPDVPVIVSPLNVAVPDAFVVAVAFVSVPAPPVMDAVTTTPAVATLLPVASLSCTTGCAESATPFVAVDDATVVRASCVPVPAVTEIVADCTPATPAAAKKSVRGPADPLIDKLENTAKPLASVVAVAGPLSVPPPDWIATPITMPDCDTGFPLASASRTEGCGANGAPLCTGVDGCWTMMICVAAPALSVMAAEVTGVYPAEENCSETCPAVPVIASPLKVAAPPATVVALAFASVPEPLASVAVTTTPAVFTRLPPASWS